MSATKLTTLTSCIDPDVRKILGNPADQQHSSVTNMVEMLILDYCQHRHISIGVSRSLNKYADVSNIDAAVTGIRI